MLVISSDEEGIILVREVLFVLFICEFLFYDVLRNSDGFEVDEFKMELKEIDLEDCVLVNVDYEIIDIFILVELGQGDQLDNFVFFLGLNGGVERGNIILEKENFGLNYDEIKLDLSNEQRDFIGVYF